MLSSSARTRRKKATEGAQRAPTSSASVPLADTTVPGQAAPWSCLGTSSGLDQIPALFFSFFLPIFVLQSDAGQPGQAHPSHHAWAPRCPLTGCAHPMAMGSAAPCAGGAVGSLCARGGCGVPIHADGEGVGPCCALAPGFPCRWRRGTARCGPGTPCRVTPTTCSRPGAGAAPPTAPGAPGVPPSCTPPPRPVSVPCAVSPCDVMQAARGLWGSPTFTHTPLTAGRGMWGCACPKKPCQPLLSIWAISFPAAPKPHTSAAPAPRW